MKNLFILAAFLTIGLMAGVASAAREIWQVVSVTAEVKKVDLENWAGSWTLLVFLRHLG